ncbi:MAG TPA: ATP-binding protein [Chryseolinea sp.]
MRIWVVLFFWMLLIDTNGQTRVVDSLQAKLRVHLDIDSTRVDIFNALSSQYQWLDFNQSLRYADEGLRIADSIGYQSGIATACFRQAHCYWALGDSDRAIERALRAVSIAENKKRNDILAESYRILAISYRDQLELGKAVSYIRQAENLAAEGKNWDLLARIYNLAGVIESTRERDDSALFYYNKSLAVTRDHAITPFHLAQVFSNIGEIYLEDDPDKGLAYFTKALGFAKETRNRSAEAGIVADIGRAHLLKNNFSEANHYLQESLKMSRDLGLKRVSRHAFYALVDLKLQEGKVKEAFNYMKAYYDVRDSLLNGSKTRQIVELETRFEKQKQDQRIQLLEQEKTIQRIWTNILIVGSLLLAVTIVIIYRLQKLRAEKARQLLETQKALNEKLQETDSIKSRFFANISHEFRTPLSLILGPVEEQLRAGKCTAEERKSLSMIQRNAHRLLSLVNQLLDLSKLDAGKMELSVTQGDLSEFLAMLAAGFDSLAEHKQVSFIKHFSPVEHPFGYDADKVEKIVTNVLFNAFKFTPPGGKVIFSFHVFPEKREVMISILDSGIGIPKDEQENIFTPFYQLKNEGEDGRPGTGLGLSLVNELVKLYGGNITVRSEPGQGTCIDVVLPILGETVSASQPAGSSKMLLRDTPLLLTPVDETSPVPEILTTERDTILVVEDNAELRNFIASGFSSHFTVLSARDGREGLELAAKYIPDVIISDVMMPNVNGYDFTARIKTDERTSHVPVVLLTARADQSSRIDGLKTGADDYIAKPFSMEELRVRVKNLLDIRQHLAEKFTRELSQGNKQPKEQSLDEKFMLKVKSVVEANIGNSLFGVEMLAAEMNLSRAQLFRKVKALMNISPSEFINDLRLQRAALLIRARADNVAQIGYAVGFNEQSYFAKRFRKKFGVSPSEYAN